MSSCCIRTSGVYVSAKHGSLHVRFRCLSHQGARFPGLLSINYPEVIIFRRALSSVHATKQGRRREYVMLRIPSLLRRLTLLQRYRRNNNVHINPECVSRGSEHHARRPYPKQKRSQRMNHVRSLESVRPTGHGRVSHSAHRSLMNHVVQDENGIVAYVAVCPSEDGRTKWARGK